MQCVSVCVRVCACVCVRVCMYVCVWSFGSHMNVAMDGGDVMSGIDPLNMAPSHRNNDVIPREKRQKRKTAAV